MGPTAAIGFPWETHRSLAEVSECERLIAEMRRRGITIPQMGRLRDLLVRVPSGCVAPPSEPDSAA